MDVVTNAKVAFVLERYALDDVSEICLRTRAMATALAERGHDVTVLTTCSRYPGQWNNDVAEGESTIDSLSVVRFRLEQRLVHRLDRPAKWLASYNTLAAKVWGHSVGPVCPGYRPYLDQFGPLFDAVFSRGRGGTWYPKGWAVYVTPCFVRHRGRIEPTKESKPQPCFGRRAGSHWLLLQKKNDYEPRQSIRGLVRLS